jgi:hypothetical protein
MKKPWYQKIITSYIPWIATGFLFVGSLLDTISNTIDLITPAVTYFGTLSAILFFIFAKVSLTRYPVRWVTEDNQLVYVRSFGIAPILTLVGVLIALWIPRFFGNYWPENILPETATVETSELNSNATLAAPTTEKRSFNTTKDVFPEFLGYVWTYNVSRVTESPDNESEQYKIGQFTKRIASIETGISDYARIIAVDQSGENYMSECSATLTSGDLDIWYVVDDTRFYVACSKEEAYQIAVDLRNENQNGPTERLLTPEYVIPFKVGNLWTWDPTLPPRDDTNYQWYVQAKVDVTVPAGEFHECFRIVLGTLGSTTIRWVCPGVGLVAAEYHHYGAINDYRAELISYGLLKTESSSE